MEQSHSIPVALMSMQARFADAILAGTKTIEFRKRRLAADVRIVLIYATRPVGLVLGWFIVDSQLIDSPESLWKDYGDTGGLSYEEFCEYFAGQNRAVGIKIAAASRLSEPRSLEHYGLTRAPRSFRYLSRPPGFGT